MIDPVKLHHSTVIALMLTLFSVAAYAQEQCRPIASPTEPVRRDLKNDTAAIFEKIENLLLQAGVFGVTKESSLFEQTQKTGKENIIVPARRAGRFEIGAHYKKIHSLLAIPKPYAHVEESYADILPLGYAPERLLSRSEKPALMFAFSETDQSLSEIWIKDPAYSTVEEIRVGSPASVLDRVEGLKKKAGGLGRNYFQGAGITYVADKKEILEIIVIRLLKSAGSEK